MTKIQRFEELRVWQMARRLANLIYDLTDQGEFARDFKLRDQIRDAASSVMHNIAEGFDDGSDGEFIHFLKYSRRSASEVQSQLYLALDRGYITKEQFQQAYDRCTETKKAINAFIAYLRRTRK
ncbi:MAG: four helix bundle protein [Anaerolineales bacterium]